MMIRRRLPVSTLPLFAAAVLLAGCGSSSNSSGSSAATSLTSTTSQTSSSSATTPTSSTGKSASPNRPHSAAAVAACKHNVQSLSQLKPRTKEHLEAVCQKAEGGDAGARLEALREGCRELVKASPLPNGAAKNRALAGCSKAGEAKDSGGK